MIPLGCDLLGDKPHAPQINAPDVLRLATVGGIAHTKGLHDAIAALADVRRSIPNFRYTIIGEARDQSYTQYLQKLIAENSLGGSVQFLLNATESEKNETLQQTDIYLQPSHV